MMRSLRLAAFCALPLLAQSSGERSPLELGFEQRVRNENWNNILDYSGASDDQRNQIRYRTRFWAKIPLSDNIDVVAGLNQETNQILNAKNHFDEVEFETAYIDIRHFLNKRLSLRLGRQNLMKGEGFILLEGNPWDGSRTIYHNAAVLSYASKKSTLDLIGILDPAYDRFLPRFHDQHRLLQEWNESALGVYYTRKHSPKTNLEAYYFYKKEYGDTRPVTHAQYQADRHIHTSGARAVRQLPRGFSLTAEAALQQGREHTGRDIAGWGGYSYVKKTFAGPRKPYLMGGYWAMSGDDPSTSSRNEGWDPIFSRWPKWSELYIYSQFREKGVAYWTNTGMWQAEAGLTPIKMMDLRLTYYRMGSYHPFTGGSSAVFSTGTLRGDHLQARMGLTVNKEWSGHVLYEVQAPGNFYRGRDAGYFLRFEIIYQHRWRIPFRHTPKRG